MLVLLHQRLCIFTYLGSIPLQLGELTCRNAGNMRRVNIEFAADCRAINAFQRQGAAQVAESEILIHLDSMQICIYSCK